jgi:hypothetical protein
VSVVGSRQVPKVVSSDSDKKKLNKPPAPKNLGSNSAAKTPSLKQRSDPQVISSARASLSPAEIREKRDAERMLLRKDMEEKRKALKEAQGQQPSHYSDDADGNMENDWVDEILVMAVPAMPPPPPFPTAANTGIPNAKEGVDDNITPVMSQIVQTEAESIARKRDCLEAEAVVRNLAGEGTWRLDAQVLTRDEYSNLGQLDYSIVLNQMQNILNLPGPRRYNSQGIMISSKQNSFYNEKDASAAENRSMLIDDEDLMSYTVIEQEDFITATDVDCNDGDKLNGSVDAAAVCENEDLADCDGVDDESDGTFDDEDVERMLEEEVNCVVAEAEKGDADSSEEAKCDMLPAEAFEQELNALELAEQFKDLHEAIIIPDDIREKLVAKRPNFDDENISVIVSDSVDSYGVACENTADGDGATSIEISSADTIQRTKFSPVALGSAVSESDDGSDVTPSAFADTLRFKLTETGIIRSVHHVHNSQCENKYRQALESGTQELGDSVFPLLAETMDSTTMYIGGESNDDNEDANSAGAEVASKQDDNVGEIRELLIEKFGLEPFNKALDFLNSLDLLNETSDDHGHDDDLDNVVMDGLEDILGLDGLKHMNELLLCLDMSQ